MRSGPAAEGREADAEHRTDVAVARLRTTCSAASRLVEHGKDQTPLDQRGVGLFLRPRPDQG
jgi:hypothetical protein